MRLERVEFDDGSIRRFDYPFVAVDKAIAKVVIDGIEYVQADKLKATNGELCAEVNELEARIAELEAGRTCQFIIEDNMNETDGMGDVWFRCTNCDTCFDYYADDWLMKMPYCPNCGARIVDKHELLRGDA
jgi:hypothetical protein